MGVSTWLGFLSMEREEIHFVEVASFPTFLFSTCLFVFSKENEKSERDGEIDSMRRRKNSWQLSIAVTLILKWLGLHTRCV